MTFHANNADEQPTFLNVILVSHHAMSSFKFENSYKDANACKQIKRFEGTCPIQYDNSLDKTNYMPEFVLHYSSHVSWRPRQGCALKPRVSMVSIIVGRWFMASKKLGASTCNDAFPS